MRPGWTASPSDRELVLPTTKSETRRGRLVERPLWAFRKTFGFQPEVFGISQRRLTEDAVAPSISSNSHLGCARSRGGDNNLWRYSRQFLVLASNGRLKFRNHFAFD